MATAMITWPGHDQILKETSRIQILGCIDIISWIMNTKYVADF